MVILYDSLSCNHFDELLTSFAATEILPSLTAKRAMKKKGVRPPSGLFITEMGRQKTDAESSRPGGLTPTSTSSNAIGRTKSVENVVVGVAYIKNIYGSLHFYVLGLVMLKALDC